MISLQRFAGINETGVLGLVFLSSEAQTKTMWKGLYGKNSGKTSVSKTVLGNEELEKAVKLLRCTKNEVS